MANTQNLIDNNSLTPEERKARAIKAAKASAEARKKKKQMRDAFDILLKKKPTPEQQVVLQKMGIDPSDSDNRMVIAVSMLQQAIGGNVKAAEFIRDTIGEKPVERVEAEVSATKEIDETLANMSLEDLRKLGGLGAK